MNITSHSSRTTRRVAAGAAALALTLAACGGDDDSSSTTTPATTDAPAGTETGSDGAATSPASLTLSDQSGDGTSVTVDAVELPSEGFIAVHTDADGSPGPVIGVSDLLPAGTTDDVVITLGDPLAETGTVFPMVHIDTDANGVYEFGTVEGVDGPGVTAGGDVAVGPVVITVDGDTGASGDDGGGDADGATITIADFAFGGVTEVPVGTTVVVTNDDAATHTWTAEDGTFDSGALGQDDSFEFTFTEAGQFSYFCNFHPSMTGQIVVTG